MNEQRDSSCLSAINCAVIHVLNRWLPLEENSILIDLVITLLYLFIIFYFAVFTILKRIIKKAIWIGEPVVKFMILNRNELFL